MSNTSFEKASRVEEIASRHILPWLAVNGAKVMETGDCEFLQRHWGDWVQQTQDGIYRSIELKAESEDKHGRFFFETWSNRKLGYFTLGWMLTCKSDFLFYYFLKEETLYVIDFNKLKLWAWGDGSDEHPGHIYKYKERLQEKYGQPNKTWGRCVPIADLMKYPWISAYRYTGNFSFERIAFPVSELRNAA